MIGPAACAATAGQRLRGPGSSHCSRSRGSRRRPGLVGTSTGPPPMSPPPSIRRQALQAVANVHRRGGGSPPPAPPLPERTLTDPDNRRSGRRWVARMRQSPCRVPLITPVVKRNPPFLGVRVDNRTSQGSPATLDRVISGRHTCQVGKETPIPCSPPGVICSVRSDATGSSQSSPGAADILRLTSGRRHR